MKLGEKIVEGYSTMMALLGLKSIAKDSSESEMLDDISKHIDNLNSEGMPKEGDAPTMQEQIKEAVAAAIEPLTKEVNDLKEELSGLRESVNSSAETQSETIGTVNENFTKLNDKVNANVEALKKLQTDIIERDKKIAKQVVNKLPGGNEPHADNGQIKEAFESDVKGVRKIALDLDALDGRNDS